MGRAREEGMHRGHGGLTGREGEGDPQELRSCPERMGG